VHAAGSTLRCKALIGAKADLLEGQGARERGSDLVSRTAVFHRSPVSFSCKTSCSRGALIESRKAKMTGREGHRYASAP
jgi:hypothetical protein